MSSFVDKLKKERNKKIKEYVKIFSEEIKDDLVDAAKKGYEGYRINLENRDDYHLLVNPEFHKLLGEEIEGCEVRIIEVDYEHAILNYKTTKQFLSINWK